MPDFDCGEYVPFHSVCEYVRPSTFRLGRKSAWWDYRDWPLRLVIASGVVTDELDVAAPMTRLLSRPASGDEGEHVCSSA